VQQGARLAVVAEAGGRETGMITEEPAQTVNVAGVDHLGGRDGERVVRRQQCRVPSFFWGLRLHLLCTLHGLPVGFAVTGAKADERQPLLGILDTDPP
jgi:hypothetical protein